MAHLSKRQQTALARLDNRARATRIYDHQRRQWVLATPKLLCVNGRTATGLLQRGLIYPYGSVKHGKYAYKLTATAEALLRAEAGAREQGAVT